MRSFFARHDAAQFSRIFALRGARTGGSAFAGRRGRMGRRGAPREPRGTHKFSPPGVQSPRSAHSLHSGSRSRGASMCVKSLMFAAAYRDGGASSGRRAARRAVRRRDGGVMVFGFVSVVAWIKIF